MRAEHASPRRIAWRWYLGALFDRPLALILAVVPSGLSALMTLPALWLLSWTLDTAIPQRRIADVALAAGGIFGLRLLAGLTLVAFARFSMPLARQATARMREDLVARLQTLAWTEHAGLEGARIAGRIVTESERVENLTQSALYNVAPTLLPLLVYAAVLFWVAPWMALIFLVLTPLLHLASRATSRRLRDAIRVFQRRFEHYHVGVHKIVHMLATARLQASEVQVMREHLREVEDLRAAGTRMAFAGIVNSQTNIVVVTAVAATLLVCGGIAVARDMLTVGQLGVFVFALTQINGATSTMIGAVSAIMGGDEALVRLHEVLALPREALEDGDPAPAAWDAITTEGLRFGYGERALIDGLSLRIAAGSVTALVAPNGVGKTSLLELLGGLHRPQGGAIRVGGVDLASVDKAAWRRRIGFVPQHPALFQGTVRENLLFGRPGIAEADLAHAIRLAALDSVLERLPGGLDAQVGDKGQMLSGGERQRVAIARALVNRPELLVLDEPTNHLDQQAIEALVERLFTAEERPTILVATHDARILAICDARIVLEPKVVALAG